jgi:hypothetical protein
VLLRAILGLPRFGQRSKFSTWLYRVVLDDVNGRGGNEYGFTCFPEEGIRHIEDDRCGNFSIRDAPPGTLDRARQKRKFLSFSVQGL